MYKKLTKGEIVCNMSKNNSKGGNARIKKLLQKNGAHIHFVGVGGVGMFSLFALTKHLGYSVSGSDIKPTPELLKLISEGERIYIGHRPENAKGADITVYTTAVAEDNPETLYSENNSILTVSRAEYLGTVMEAYRERIGVSGSHGKSTVTAMISHILLKYNKEPTVISGAPLERGGVPYRFGSSEYFVYESCEYKDAFLSFSPTVSVFTNLELDHVDYFHDIEAIKKSFAKAMEMPNLSVVNIDDENIASILPDISKPKVTVGECESADYRITDVHGDRGKYSFKISHGREVSLEIKLDIIGRFNVTNAALALVASEKIGVPVSDAAKALSLFCGIPRRLEYLGRIEGKKVFYDYAHHPTEITSSLMGVKEYTGERVSVIFRPHTYSRTAGFFKEFAEALSGADEVFLMEISAVREKRMEGVTSEKLIEYIGKKAKSVSAGEILSCILNSSSENVIIMGAADIDLEEVRGNLK